MNIFLKTFLTSKINNGIPESSKLDTRKIHNNIRMLTGKILTPENIDKKLDKLRAISFPR
jgi:hypothetical protein